MKILKLRFKNLNSLVGEWEIDFTDPRYLSDGIFAISGPTGAGKSTILDAICLALYARTPRLGPITKTGNEIMSRQTGECFSEVVFETQKGRFRCTWSQHRARKKVNGNLADPNHEIALAESGEIVESKRSRTADAIEERTGMNFGRFTQSMLLAQGGFAAFLVADPNERAPILEQITGTEIYSDISIASFNRQRSEKGKLELLQAETGGIALLNPEEEDLLNQNLTTLTEAESEKNIKKANISSAISWLERIETLKKELDGIALENETHTIALEEFAGNRLKLDRARKAFELDGEYVNLQATRKRQKEEVDALGKSESEIPGLELQIETANIRMEAAKTELGKVAETAAIEREQSTKVRAVDVKISGKQEILKTAETDLFKTQKLQNTNINNKKEFQKLAIAAGSDSELTEKYLSAHQSDGILVSELAGIREVLNNLDESKKTLSAIGKNIINSKKALEGEDILCKKQKELCRLLIAKRVEAEKSLSEIKAVLSALLGDRQLREIRAEHDHLLRELGFLRKIKGLEAERALLEDAKPCPLCGSLHHPFAEGNIPETDDTDKKISELAKIIDEAENLDKKQRTQETQVQQAINDLSEAENQLILAQHKKKECEKAVDSLIEDEKVASEKWNSLTASVLYRLQPLGVSEIPENNSISIVSLLDNRLNNWKYHQDQKNKITQKIQILESEIKTTDTALSILGESLKHKTVEIEAHKKEIADLQLMRQELYGLKDPDTEERRLEGLVKNAGALEREASEKFNDLNRQLDKLNEKIKDWKESTSKRQEILDNNERQFKENLGISGFSDETDFLACQLSKEQREKLAGYALELDSKKADCDSRKKDRENLLALEWSKNITDIPLDNLKNELEIINQGIKLIAEEIGGIKQKLSNNTDAKTRFSKIMQLIVAQKAECRKWDSLQALIGSADGKKYRNFAQGITFELMVSHANRQLSKLTDRYLLIRDDLQPLDLNVIDNYQAGEIRSTKNLSGGESFIVSLALALGLSHMASRNVRVDSLFLDEGFGSLDEETLETALETLAGLRQDGKLIGVISHVSALKERISTQILVQPVSGGKSTLKGPGCRQING